MFEHRAVTLLTTGVAVELRLLVTLTATVLGQATEHTMLV